VPAVTGPVVADAYRLGVAQVPGLANSGDGARWRVFISHTSELRNYPKGMSYVAAAERAISAAGHVIVDMADFPAAGQAPARVCADRVRGCDVYVGVLGHPVRLAGAGQARDVVYRAGVRHGNRGGPGPAPEVPTLTSAQETSSCRRWR
jgi:hypothetical protein